MDCTNISLHAYVLRWIESTSVDIHCEVIDGDSDIDLCCGPNEPHVLGRVRISEWR